MNLFKKIYFYVKISFLYCTGRRIGEDDYKKDYDSISKKYEGLWIKQMKGYSSRLVSGLKIHKGDRVLDLACGTGFVTLEIAKKLKNSGEVYAVDISKKMLDIAKKKNKYKNIKFIEGDILEEIKKLPSNYFDSVVCAWALAYTNPKKLLKEIKRVLKDKGYVMIVVNRKGTLSNIESAFVELMKKYPQNIKKVMSIRYILPRDKDHLKKLFMSAGLKPVKVWQDEKAYRFKKGVQAYEWVRDCGAIAGTGQIMNFDVSKKIGEILDRSARKQVTHKFVMGIAKK